MSHAKCDPDVFAHGQIVGMLATDTAHAEQVCELMRAVAAPGAKVDWHFYAGRAVFKFLPQPVGAPRG